MSFPQSLYRGRFSGLPVLSAIIALLTIALLARASVNSENEPDAPLYLHAVASEELVMQSQRAVERRYTGIVSARQHADIGFELGGKIARVLVDEGLVVEKGALLAELDVELLNIERQQLEAQIDEAQARLVLSQNSLKRQQSLKQSGFSSAQRLDELGTEERSLQATLKQLEAAVSSVDTRIEKAVLLAPFSGVVTRRFADQGSVAGAGAAIVRLQQEGSMEAHVGVPVKLIENFVPGQQQPLQLHKQLLAATVLTVGADIHPVTRTVSVRLSLPESAHGVNGDLVYLNVNEQVRDEGYWVSADAVTDGIRGLWRTYVLVPAEDKIQYEGEPTFIIQARDVQVDYADESQVYINGAVEPGEYIVSGGLHRVAPGQRVRLSGQG